MVRGKKNNNKVWRPMQLSDFGDDGSEDTGSSFGGFGDGDLSAFTDIFSSKIGQGPAHKKASPFDLPQLQTSFGNMNSFPTSVRDNSEDVSPTDTRSGVVENYTRLFGILPDPIRLHEQLGKFDGQVTFIGHPNRDISAHQWSSISFQWVNIGLYSHTRRKIEGSLASDRLRGVSFVHNTIEYFKAMAEQREINIKENGRPEEQKPDPPSAPRVETMRRPGFTKSERVASLSSASNSTGDQAPPLLRTSFPRVSTIGNSAPTTDQRTVTRDYLEDPFVTPARVPHPAIPVAFRFRGSILDDSGAMDFNYEFPTKAPASRSSGSNEQQLFIQRERERLDMIRRGINPQEPKTNLRDIDFGEEAFGSFGAPARRSIVNGQLVLMSPEDAHSRQILKNRLAELGDSVRRLTLPSEARVAVPDVQVLQATTPTLGPPSGFTVANPHRVVSTLNANAAPYKQMSAYNQGNGPASGSEVTTVNALPVTNLQYSDPDGARIPHIHEIANGLGQQAPTPQSFRGPFFTDSMPTTHDPTTSLSFQISDKEKLENWFRDGQRPARQQEYARTLMATANTESRTRNAKHFGAIGEASWRKKEQNKYENTPAFVTLYESVYEYIEESRAEARSDYFTRAWKPAPLYLRHIGPGGDESFFGESPGYSTSPRAQRIPQAGFQAFGGQSWGGFGLHNQANPPNQPLVSKRYTHGVGDDSGFGGPGNDRY
jgi:hypothetical protein